MREKRRAKKIVANYGFACGTLKTVNVCTRQRIKIVIFFVVNVVPRSHHVARSSSFFSAHGITGITQWMLAMITSIYKNRIKHRRVCCTAEWTLMVCAPSLWFVCLAWISEIIQNRLGNKFGAVWRGIGEEGESKKYTFTEFEEKSNFECDLQVSSANEEREKEKKKTNNSFSQISSFENKYVNKIDVSVSIPLWPFGHFYLLFSHFVIDLCLWLASSVRRTFHDPQIILFLFFLVSTIYDPIARMPSSALNWNDKTTVVA